MVSQTTLVKKNHQISRPFWKKIAEYHVEKLTNAAIARRLHISVSTVQRKFNEFNFQENFHSLPTVLSWDEFSRIKES